jgi:hypothetical protein
MWKLLSLSVTGILLSFFGYAQDNGSGKKFNHYLGFQANELMRQLVNFDDASNPVNNPYLGIYAINFAESGFGFHAGFGFEYNMSVKQDDPGGKTTKVSRVFNRVGAEKKFTLGKRFDVKLSLDFTNSYQHDNTISPTVLVIGATIDSTENNVSEKITSIGGGPRASLLFYITDKIILSTEVMMYYNSENQKKNILSTQKITDTFNNIVQFSSSNFNTSSETKKIEFTIPASLFLIVKF